MAEPETDTAGRIEAGILENALVMIIVLDHKGTILAWNHAAESITGYTRDEVIGKRDVWKLLYPDKKYRDSITAKIATILSAKQYFENLETTIRTRSGSFRIILWNTKEVVQDGNARAVAVGIDVTEQRQADLFRTSIIDNAYILIAVLDHGKVLVWNKAAETITGYTQEQVIGKRDVWKLLYPDAEYRRTVTRQITEIIGKNRYFENLETTIVTRSGQKKIISWNTRRIGTEGTQQDIAIGLDVTEQRQADLFRSSIIDNAHIMIAVLDHGKVLVWNKAAETITEYTREQVIGKLDVWKQLYPDPEYRRTVTRQITEIIEKNRYFENLETTIVTRSGQKKIISWNTRQIGTEGTQQDIAIGLDITARKQAEEALISYMTEMAMRLKGPVEIIRDNLNDVAKLIREGKLTPEEIAMVLDGQVRNANQVAYNVKEFQRAIAQKNKEIPDAYRKFLEGE
jgi:PAS domain S-box-containing protein